MTRQAKYHNNNNAKFQNKNANITIEKKYKGNKKDMVTFAKFIAKDLDVKNYKDTLYFKDGIKYSNNENKLSRAIVKYLKLSSRQINEVLFQLKLFSDYIEDNKVFKIKLRNGVINGYSIENKNYGFTPFYLDIDYNPQAYDKHVDNFLKFASNNRPDVRLVLEELLGHILMVNEFPHKMFFLVGLGANGKSTYVEMVTNFVGDLSSHIDIASFNDGTSLVSLIGKLVNIADDVDPIYINKSKNIKTLASGNTISARAIYKKNITIKSTASLIFTTNEMPAFKDTSKGIMRRLIIIPFDNVVTNRINNLNELLSTDNAKSYLLNLALAGIKRIYENNMELSNSETINSAIKDYQLEHNGVMSFLETKPDIIDKTNNEALDMYLAYANENGAEFMSQTKFTRQIKQLGYDLKVDKRNGKSVKVVKKL